MASSWFVAPATLSILLCLQPPRSDSKGGSLNRLEEQDSAGVLGELLQFPAPDPVPSSALVPSAIHQPHHHRLSL
ncbi:hypothetical protein AAC387_Pa06g1444 [Persea americana]